VTVIILLYLAFIFTGVLTALPGPFLPFLLKRWGLTDAQAGSIIAAQFPANMIGALFANRNLRISIGIRMIRHSRIAFPRQRPEPVP
jgi:fucose permease